MKKKRTFLTSLLCLFLAVAFFLTDTASVEAASNSVYHTYKTVQLNDSAINMTQISYNTKPKMVLSDDGNTLIFKYSGVKKDGSYIKSYNLKKYIPDDILKKFEDGEVYLYREYTYASFDEDFDYKDDLAEAKKEAAKISNDNGSGKVSVRVEHQVDGVKTKHTNAGYEYTDGDYGDYVVICTSLVSDAKGNGKITSDDPKFGTEMKTKTTSYAVALATGTSATTIYTDYYLADKNGKRSLISDLSG